MADSPSDAGGELSAHPRADAGSDAAPTESTTDPPESLAGRVRGALDIGPATLAAALGTLTSASSLERPGDTIGHFKLRERIGEGGFGVVWLAEQTEPVRRRVALKVIKPGMDSKAVIARFDAERQALALMDHPNIARVFEAGATPAGRPYFVMEYVPGVPITEHCDRHRLTVQQRLELFATVCDAVAHAHTKGIIHRDLKPSNILVSFQQSAVSSQHGGRIGSGSSPSIPQSLNPSVPSPSAQPKIIDFGVAKATQMRLTEQTVFTEHGQLIGTPEYMSPEQAEMSQQDIDTRSDVYSLGVLLYELLTGTPPFDSKRLRSGGLNEIRRIIREVQPLRPSTRVATSEPRAEASGHSPPHARSEPEAQARVAATPPQPPSTADRLRTTLPVLIKQLRSELEWIPLKALRKDRSERYRSATEMADDVRNYLAGRPLIAGPESTAYRMRKFVRRNRGAVAAGSVMVVLLVGGLLATSLTANWALHERGEAIRARDAESAALAEKSSALTEKSTALQRESAANSRAQFELYVANLAAAEMSIDAAEPVRARARLDACPPSLRRWEWGWLNARSDGSQVVCRGHGPSDGNFVIRAGARIVCWAEFNPDGTRVATASSDGTARIWDSATGEELLSMRCPDDDDEMQCAAFSPDGTRILTAASDGNARLWDAVTGREIRTLQGHERAIFTVHFSPDGHRILTASADDTARIWEADSGREIAVLRGHTSSVRCAAFSADAARIVTASYDDTARVWDTVDGRELAVLRGHTSTVNTAAFSPDAASIVTASEDGTARIWETGTGLERSVLRGHTSDVCFAVFSPDGRLIATSSRDNTVRLWSATDGREIAVLRGHRDWAYWLAFSPDGERLASASIDATARLWDVNSARAIGVLRGHEALIISVRFSPDGKRIVTAACDGTARIWDVPMVEASDSRSVALGGGFAGVFSPDGSRIVVAGEHYTARVLDSHSGVEWLALRGHSQDVTSADFCRDGRKILTTSSDGTARIWDAASGVELAVLRGHTKGVLSGGFSRDGAAVVTASADTTALVWKATTGAVIAVLRGHSNEVVSAAFDPAGTRVLTVSDDGTARLWDAGSGRESLELEGHELHMTSAAFNSDGTRVITASHDDTARVWDAATGSELAILRGHTDDVRMAAFSPDGLRAITVSDDNTARVWEVATGRELFSLQEQAGMLAVFTGASGVVSAAFSPDGARLVTASRDRSARVWDASSGREVAVLRGHTDELDFVTFSADGTRILTSSDDETVRLWDSIPNRIRHAERLARERGEDGDAIVRAYLEEVTREPAPIP